MSEGVVSAGVEESLPDLGLRPATHARELFT
jgi:hypothetical protein